MIRPTPKPTTQLVRANRVARSIRGRIITAGGTALDRRSSSGSVATRTRDAYGCRLSRLGVASEPSNAVRVSPRAGNRRHN